MFSRLRREGLAARLILQVHDDLIVECPQKKVECVSAILTEEMEGGYPLGSPLVAEAHWGQDWLSAK